MKGLFIKDMRLIMTMRQQLIIFLAVCALIAFTAEGSFVVGYTSALLGILGLSTLGFDEHENGFPFLFSLPVDAKSYVNEKYLLCILLDVAGLMFGTVLFFLACLTRGRMAMFQEDIVYVVFYLPATLLLILSILPVQMIFGREKSRIITFILYGVLFGLSAVLAKIIGPLDKVKSPQNLPEWMTNPFVISAALCALVLVVCVALYCVCLKAMRNKEF